MKLKVKKLGGLGLLFRRRQKLPCLIKRVGSGAITTWFVFHSIDLVFLDVNCVVLGMKYNVKPFSTYRPPFDYSFVLEFPAGKATNIVPRERLDLEIVNL
jgi:uncharacterized membrane protein (UPF0127 family)